MDAISAVSASFADCFFAICVAKSAVTVLGLFLLPFALGIIKPPEKYSSLSIALWQLCFNVVSNKYLYPIAYFIYKIYPLSQITSTTSETYL